MCLDPTESEPLHRFSLAPLGYDINLGESVAALEPAELKGRDLGGGFRLYPEFEEIYDQLYGDLYVGQPLTQVRFNQNNQRYEQFFANVGFYRNLVDPEGDAHLVTYGAYLCGANCSYNLDQYWNIVKSDVVTEPFGTSIQRFGWSEIGSPLTQPIYTDDGYVEQFYDNVVLFAPQSDLGQMRFRPLPLWLGIPVEALAERNPHEQLVFYEVENGLGHNVPFFFDRFIAGHGGRDLAGNPISEFAPMEAGVFQQCFENYCLQYDENAPEESRVKMAALGAQLMATRAYEFLQRIPRDPNGLYSMYLPLIIGSTYLCGTDCSNELEQNQYLNQSDPLAQAFETSIRRFGWSEIGSPLSPPFLTKEGFVERYYENAVLYAPKEDLGQMRFRPLPLWMKIPIEALAERNPHEQLVFYEVEMGLGHNVPFFFDRFIAGHGGRDLAGNPINELAPYTNGIFRQCFENYCLLYDTNNDGTSRVKMAPLGAEYLKSKNPNLTLMEVFNSTVFQIVLEEEKAQIRENEEQHIRIFVLRANDLAPISLVEGTLELNLPGKDPEVYHFRSTDQNGMSEVTLPPISGVPAMSAVEYRVCLNIPGDQPICSVDSFIYRGR